MGPGLYDPKHTLVTKHSPSVQFAASSKAIKDN